MDLNKICRRYFQFLSKLEVNMTSNFLLKLWDRRNGKLRVACTNVDQSWSRAKRLWSSKLL